MNNKGFTLIELLAVIIILIGIAGVAVANVTSSLEKNEKRDCEKQRDLVINAAKVYFSLNSDNEVSVRQLITRKFIEKNTDVSGVKGSAISIYNYEYAFQIDEADACFKYFSE